MRLLLHVLVWVCISRSLFAATSLLVNVGGDAAPSSGGVSSGTTSGDLRYVLNYANENPSLAPFNVTFSGSGIGTIAINGLLPLLNFNSTGALSIDGGGAVTIDGGSTYPGFVAVQGSVALSNLTINNCLSQGGDGGTGFAGGGGGAGLGGSLLIDQASVVLDSVNFTNSSAIGGNAGTSTGSGGSGGGGGLFGARGGDSTSDSGGGGGGMGGNGGAATTNGDGGGGGGIGLGGTGAAGGAGGSSSGSGQSGIGLASTIIPGADGANNAGSGGTDSGGGGGGIGGGGGGGGGNVSHQPVAGGATLGGAGGYGGGGGGGASGALGGTGGFGGGGGAAGHNTSPPEPFQGNAGYGGGSGGIPSVESFGGSSLGGAIHLNSGGSLTFTGGGEILNSTLTQGSPSSLPIDYQSGWSIYADNMPITFSPSSGQTISITENFNLLGFAGFLGTNGNFLLTGPGTLSLASSALTTPENNDVFPSTYISNSATIAGGTLLLQGGERITVDGQLAPIPIFGVTTTITVENGATLGGNGTIGSSADNYTAMNTTIIQSGGILAATPGLLYVGGLDLQPGSIVQSTITPTTPGTFAANTISGPSSSIGLDLSGASLNINLASGSYPTTPTVYTVFLGPSDFQSQFSSISINGGSASAYYTPPNAPNAIVVPFNVPEGISSATLLVGNLSYNTTVLFDPCAGIVVLSLVLPGEVAAALSSFALNQSQLTLQALGILSTTLNNSVSQQNRKGGATLTSPVALLEREKHFIAHGAAPKPLMPASYVALDEDSVNTQEPKRLPWLPSIETGPQWSISLNPFGQFQNQNAVVTDTASFPSYRTNTGGVIAECDYIGSPSMLLGGAATYAYTNLTIADHGGRQNVNSVFGTIYNGWILDPWAFNFVVTGSYNRNNVFRNILSIPGQSFTVLDISVFGFTQTYTLQTAGLPSGHAKAAYNTYQIVPHFDLNYELGFDWISLLPFITSDCIINFEDTVIETGAPMLIFSACGTASTLNTTIQSVVSYMLQNETGLNLFEQINLEKGKTLIFRQKGSYINRYTLPYVIHSNFVAATSPFTSTLIKLPMQHFFGSSLEMVYRHNLSSVTFTYESVVGSGFMFNAGFLRYTFDF